MTAIKEMAGMDVLCSDKIGTLTHNKLTVDKNLVDKLQVWCQLQNGYWESGQIRSTSAYTTSILLENGNVVTVSTGDLLPAIPDILEGVNDLMELSYLKEPSVLHNLQYRYARDTIYSKSGPFLIAINPFKKVELYGNDYVTAYRQKLLDIPHVYDVADIAYSEMMRGALQC